MPIEVLAETIPCAFVPRIALGTPETTRFVVEAVVWILVPEALMLVVDALMKALERRPRVCVAQVQREYI